MSKNIPAFKGPRVRYSGGERFGSLTVNTPPEYRRNYYHKYEWKLTCDCGKSTWVTQNSLQKLDVKSCGCMIHMQQKTAVPGKKYTNWTDTGEFRVVMQKNTRVVQHKCVCICGTVRYVSTSHLFSGASKSCGCIKPNMPRGVDHKWYKPELSDSERKAQEKRRKRSSNKWDILRRQVFKRDDYTCDLCKTRGGQLHAHHLMSWNQHKKLRYVADNIITLCSTCHYKFHKVYGRGDNTKSQYEEFRKEKQNDKYNKKNSFKNIPIKARGKRKVSKI